MVRQKLHQLIKKKKIKNDSRQIISEFYYQKVPKISNLEFLFLCPDNHPSPNWPSEELKFKPLFYITFFGSSLACFMEPCTKFAFLSVLYSLLEMFTFNFDKAFSSCLYLSWRNDYQLQPERGQIRCRIVWSEIVS